MFISFLLVLIFWISKNSNNIQIKQVIDCWTGDQIETPNVKFVVNYAVQGNYCLIER